jgi:hypothetical protein
VAIYENLLQNKEATIKSTNVIKNRDEIEERKLFRLLRDVNRKNHRVSSDKIQDKIQIRGNQGFFRV